MLMFLLFQRDCILAVIVVEVKRPVKIIILTYCAINKNEERYFFIQYIDLMFKPTGTFLEVILPNLTK